MTGQTTLQWIATALENRVFPYCVPYIYMYTYVRVLRVPRYPVRSDCTQAFGIWRNYKTLHS